MDEGLMVHGQWPATNGNWQVLYCFSSEAQKQEDSVKCC